MAKRGGVKGNVSYDYHNLKPEQKAKIQALSETYPEAEKAHIAIVLQYFDFDQDLATNALTKDGGSAALCNWYSKDNNQTKVTKNKKKNKKKNRKDNGSLIGGAQGTDAEDSSSLHSSNIDFDGEKDSSSKLDYACDEMSGKVERDILNMCNNVATGSFDERETSVIGGECNDLSERAETPEEGKSDDGLLPSIEVDYNEDSAVENAERLSPKESGEEHTRYQPTKHTPRQRHGSAHHSKSSSISEDPSSQASQKSGSLGYTKSRKDLGRQTVSLQNIQLKLENKLDEAEKCLKNSFSEVRNLLDKRQAEMESELEKVKHDALKLLKSRRDLAQELKMRVDRASNAPDSEWAELKADIKQFVMERKYDELLGKTTWFIWSRDAITEEIQKLGEVTPVKNAYSQRNLHSRNQSSPEPSMRRIRYEAGEDSDVRNDEGLTHEEEGPIEPDTSAHSLSPENEDTKVGKEIPVKIGQGENRGARVFCNRQYNRQNYGGRYPNHNRGARGGYFRGRGNTGGYNRGVRHYENNYRQYGGGERYDHRPQQYSQDRMEFRHGSGEAAESRVQNVNDGNNASMSYATNPRDHQDHGRNQDRRPFGGYRGGGGHTRPYNNYQRNRGLHKPPRSNSEAVTSGAEVASDTNANYDQTSQENPSVVNGYLN